jgi:hypothetical protein
MSINGVSASTLNGDRAASSDGVDDFTVADGPQNLPENETFGVAMVFNSTDDSTPTAWFGAEDRSDATFFRFLDSAIINSGSGELLVTLNDGRNAINVETTTKIADGATHLICVNKTSDAITDIDIYVDDMQTPVNVDRTSSGFDHTAYTISSEMGFFARKKQARIGLHKTLDLPFIEFNEQPYSQQDRLDLKQRAPGL